jgi:hypothetical protein
MHSILAGGDGWVRVTLVWSDPAASPAVEHGEALVNNLDLDVSFTADYPTVEATTADPNVYKGNAFYNMPDYTTSADGYDKINNVEVSHRDRQTALPAWRFFERCAPNSISSEPRLKRREDPPKSPAWESGEGPQLSLPL